MTASGGIEPAPSDAALIGAVPAPDLHVMTLNVRRPVPSLRRGGPDAWSTRAPALRRLLLSEQPSVLGVQEAVPGQVRFLTEGLGPSFAAVGRGRNPDGGGEQCAILFDSQRLRLTDWAQYALSDSPDVPGSRSWGNLFPRIAVRAQFVDLATGARLSVLNTHLDHLSARSRLRSARMLAGIARTATAPTVLLGDANTAVATAPYRELVDAGPFRDAWTDADRRLTESWGTYSRYRAPRVGGRQIDWILVSGGIRVARCGINAARFDGAAASDHEPVQAVLRVGALADSPATGG
ncbi:endonuclease/exonuclease/phosphatase family protein [Planctomonas psychrotolerans]|uniref:endonuclease/exonuclease/phosphatase family protein n=1 Tax=Planctomonas psychrotolerans TaxID=2528712 RepID=UPI00123ADAB0|nr:endonuclease/exonuclease/phosphatase family protein [Planctomonas psychrotolerans]